MYDYQGDYHIVFLIVFFLEQVCIHTFYILVLDTFLLMMVRREIHLRVVYI